MLGDETSVPDRLINPPPTSKSGQLHRISGTIALTCHFWNLPSDPSDTHVVLQSSTYIINGRVEEEMRAFDRQGFPLMVGRQVKLGVTKL
jgi:hypothetical protein